MMLWNPGAAIVTIIRRRCWSTSAKSGSSLFVGQEQEYFLCRLHADAPEPSLDHREFCAYRWIAPAGFKLEWLPEFKKEVYARVLADFFNVRARDK